MLKEVVVAKTNEEKFSLSVLCDKIESVLQNGSKEGALALIPQLQSLCEKIRRIRQRSADYSTLAISEYVMAVATLAGRKDEFAEFA